MIYCDNCGKVREYPINEKKVKGSCEVCFKYAGPCNETKRKDLPFDKISRRTLELAGFKLTQLEGVPVNPRVDMVEPGSPHKFISTDKVIYFKHESIVFLNTTTGKRVQVQF